MLLKVFKSKIHRAIITGADLNYEGSISIDKALMDAAGLYKYEAVWIWNINNGERLMTYIIEAEPDSGTICLNGAAARLCSAGDPIIITAFADITLDELENFKPTVVLVDEKNKIKKIMHSSGTELAVKHLTVTIGFEHNSKLFKIAQRLKTTGFHIEDIRAHENAIHASVDDLSFIDEIRQWVEVEKVDLKQ